jgi:c-di-GMP-binding flagellar brake protein YcgR
MTTMVILAPLAIFVLLLAALTAALSLKGGSGFSGLEFLGRARAAGFSFAEAQRIRGAAKVAHVEDPLSLFRSPRDLDRVISVLIASFGGAPRGREAARFMDRIYELRRGIEFEQPRYKMGIKSSRQFTQGQRLRLLVQGLGVAGSTVIDNNPRFLVVSFPAGIRVPKDYVWKGKKVSVYLWRRDDAGYVFDTYVLEDLRIRNVPVLHMAHSESLLRTQKRKSIRARASIPAYLYLLKRIEGAFEKAERDPGLRCLVQDVSEDGMAIAIGGKAAPGLQVKAQFTIGGRQVVMSGTVRSVDWDGDHNRSILHVEAVPPSPRTRNAIRSYVYNIRASGAEGLSALEAGGQGAGV